MERRSSVTDVPTQEAAELGVPTSAQLFNLAGPERASPAHRRFGAVHRLLGGHASRHENSGQLLLGPVPLQAAVQANAHPNLRTRHDDSKGDTLRFSRGRVHQGSLHKAVLRVRAFLQAEARRD